MVKSLKYNTDGVQFEYNNKNVSWIDFSMVITEVPSEHCKTSKMERFVKIVNGF